MRVAVIDIGSNTIHLLIAESDGTHLTAIADPSRALFLGQDVARDGAISLKKVGQAVGTVVEFTERAQASGADVVVSLATEAIRAASNGEAIITLLRASGIDIRLLAPRREGELAAYGALLDSHPRGPALLADIGGGSTQLVTIAGHRPVAVRSVRLGSGMLATTIPGDPPSPTAIAALGARIGPQLESALGSLPAIPEGVRAIGVGGTLRRLGRLVGRELPPVDISRAALEQVVDSLLRSPAEVLAKKHELDAKRVATLRVGGLVILALLDRIGTSRLRVSAAGIREGAALLLARGEDPAADPV